MFKNDVHEYKIEQFYKSYQKTTAEILNKKVMKNTSLKI